MTKLSPAAFAVMDAVVKVYPAFPDEVAAAALRAAALYCKRDSIILLSLAAELEAQ
jgi:hypothetical protein